MFSDNKTLSRALLPALLSLALLFSLIEFLITVILVHNYNDHDYPSNSIRDRLRFLLFTSIWNLILLPLFIFANWKLVGHVLSSVVSNLAVMSLTWVFWLAGAAAWTDALGGTLHCGDLFFGSQLMDISIPYCHSLRAVQAFSWMIWILLTVALAYVSGVAMRARSQPTGLNGPMREVPAAV